MEPPLVQRWLDSVSGWDVEALLELYMPDAVVEAGRRVEGRQAIGTRLRRYRRKFHDLRIDLVDEPQRRGDTWAFTTDVTAHAGRWMLRHVLRCEGGRIAHHGVETRPLPTPASATAPAPAPVPRVPAAPTVPTVPARPKGTSSARRSTSAGSDPRRPPRGR